MDPYSHSCKGDGLNLEDLVAADYIVFEKWSSTFPVALLFVSTLIGFLPLLASGLYS